MQNKILYVIIIAMRMTSPLSCFSQATALKIGDQFPDIEISNVTNLPSAHIKLSQFSGKWVILDFWSTMCISCIQSFPYMDSLQKTFKDSLQIIMVNHETMDSTQHFFTLRKKIHRPSIPMITSDTLLDKLFPHYGVPYHVWIDPKGIVRYTAASYYTTPLNVFRILQGQSIYIPVKKRTVYKEHLFDSSWYELLQSYSYLSKARNGLHLESGGRTGYELITCEFNSVEQLYQKAYDGITGNKFHFLSRPGITQLEVKQPEKFQAPESGYLDWIDKYAYNYQLCIPENQNCNKYVLMKEDLDRYFRLVTHIEKRKVKCLVLIKTRNIEKIKTKGSEPADTWNVSGILSTKKDSVTYFINQPFSKFSFRLSRYIEAGFHVPFIDSTGYHGNIDVIFPDKLFDQPNLKEIRSELQGFGLDLIEKTCLLNVLVIKEKI